MRSLLLVDLAHGPDWDPARTLREQDGWDAHAAFMDGLTAEGVVVLGGPVGPDEDADTVLLVVDLPGEDAVRARLAQDPWARRLLTVTRVRAWTVLLGT